MEMEGKTLKQYTMELKQNELWDIKHFKFFRHY